MRKITRLAIAAGALALMLALAGCGGSKDAKPAAEGGALKGALTLYTSQPEADAQKLIAAFNKKHPDVKVQIFRSGTEEVVSKVLAEEKAGAIQADMLLIAEDVTFEILKERKLLEPHKSVELKEIPAEFVDKDNMYVGTKVMTTGLMYNTTRGLAPLTSFADLAKPAYKNEAVMPSPMYSGAAAYNVGLMSRTQGLGWQYFEALKANNIKVDKGNGAVQKAVVAGDKACGMIVDYLVMRAKAKGAPVEFVYPAEGSPVITEPIAILKTSKNIPAAKAFVDFIISKEGQELAASQGYTPIRKGIAAPAGLKSIDQIKVMKADVNELYKNRAADKKHFVEIFNK